jgi:DNA-binding response OmpR family regulator
MELPIAGDGDQELESLPIADRLWRVERHGSGPVDGDCHILVVDDEPAVAQLVQRVLEHEGFHVTTACEPRKALAILERSHFDLIVSDMSMPRMNGEQFWQVVAEQHPRLASRIIFSSGDSSGRRARVFLESSGCAYIRKPFDPEELIRMVRETLRRELEAAPVPG